MNHPFFRFLLVGLMNTAVGLSSMYMLLHLAHFSYWWATLIGNTIGAIVSYILNRVFTFQSNAPIADSAVRFLIVIMTCYFVSYRLAKQIADWTMTTISIVPPHYTNDIAILFGTALYTVLNYLGQKRFVFVK
ncbi:GtrA family protein [Thermaerobacillus caldiproteolyticus]|uniref:Putative flippase GtrA n=1 Tax=Thermaerobacillus caldiproteolyticus TaxID=247480 RepID=A0A7V9Z817_9BACL|nr:GtrA family protein [Anoxybacillus caldiproteolyticus]MBA2875765.1 putative flippase GtrA [Anoxybacillus caldiproteolyticus]QPA30664.1 GtrA family protein [Anoxybacillus caldiproteolyticus]